MTPLVRARLSMLAAAALFSTGGAAVKLAALTPWQVASFRSGIAALVLCAVVRPPLRALDGRVWLVGAALAATMVLFVFSTKLTTAANAIFLQSAAPFYILLLSPWLLREHVTRRDLGVMAAMALGLVLVFAADQPSLASAPDPARGNAIACVAALAWALTVIGLRWLGRDAGSQHAVLITGNLLVFACVLPMALPVDRFSPADAAVIAFLGTCQITIPYFFVAVGLQRLTALEGALFMLIEPILNPIWAWMIHGERPGWPALVGGAVIIAATAWHALKAGTARRD
ncbi:MAG: DMT family transporter [Candidatus Binatia bacterium]